MRLVIEFLRGDGVQEAVCQSIVGATSLVQAKAIANEMTPMMRAKHNASAYHVRDLDDEGQLIWCEEISRSLG